MESTDIIIVGAGVAGLMAASKLIEHGKNVIVLEARERTGGRIHTTHAPFSGGSETGAEFIHGNLPLTLKLLDEAGIAYHAAYGEFVELTNHGEEKQDDPIDGQHLLARKLRALKHDMTVDDFLHTHFPGDEYSEMKRSTKRFIEGYEAADTSRAGILSLKDDLINEDFEDQYRISGGYQRLIQYLEDAVASNNGSILLNEKVQHIQWRKGNVVVRTASGDFEATKVLITVPLGVLQKGRITFSPEIPGQIHALDQLGNGLVIKVLIEFKESFWKKEEIENLVGRKLDKMGFLFADESIPTWWTQYPQDSKLLTGWLAGPACAAWANKPDADILQIAIASLVSIFKMQEDELEKMVVASYVANWVKDEYSMGGYSYPTVQTGEALKLLRQSVDRTIFFAGEAIYDGISRGTVEAALTSALEVVGHMID